MLPINTQQYALLFLGKLKYWLIYILDYLLFLTYKKKWTRTHISLLPICKLNYKILLPHHSLDKYHHFFPNPTAYSLPCVLIHQSKFFLHKVPQIYLWIVQLLLIYLIFDCDKRQSRGGIREGGGEGKILNQKIASVLLIWFLCVKSNTNKKRSQQKTSRTLRRKNPLSANKIVGDLNPNITWQIKDNNIYLKSKIALQLLRYSTFIYVLKYMITS